MATSKPKRMMMGGTAKPAGVPAFAKPYVDKMRGASPATPKPGMPPKPIRDIGTGSMPRPGGPKPGIIGPRTPRPPMQGGGGKPTGIGQAMGPRGALGAAGAMAGRALGMGKKKGGAVKKANKK